MTGSSSLRLTRPVKAVDPFTRRVLGAVDAAATRAGCRFFVAGATARDLMLSNVFGMKPGVATRDIDFGVAVANPAQFDALQQALIDGGGFERDAKIPGRMLFCDAESNFRAPVDLIPFGGIASEGKPGAGFEEALDAAIRLEVDTGLAVRVASIAGLTILKLLAWSGHRKANNRAAGNNDARDLLRLIEHYADAGNSDRINDNELSLLESEGFDLDLAGAHLLGRDAARICRPYTRQRIARLLASDAVLDELCEQMNCGHLEYEAPLERATALVTHFRTGFLAA